MDRYDAMIVAVAVAAAAVDDVAAVAAIRHPSDEGSWIVCTNIRCTICWIYRESRRCGFCFICIFNS